MEKRQTTDQDNFQIKTAGDICKDILLGNSPLAEDYRKWKSKQGQVYNLLTSNCDGRAE